MSKAKMSIEGEVRKELEKFGKALDEHYGIIDFGCDGCKKIVDSALSAILESVTDNYVTFDFHEKHLKENKDYYEKTILKLTNLPLSEKEVEKEILDSKIIKFTQKTERKLAELMKATFDDPEDIWLKNKVKELAHAICSHFSKPVIKYPEKKRPSEIIQLDVCTQATEKGKLYYEREWGKQEGYNNAISDMHKLNGEGGYDNRENGRLYNCMYYAFYIIYLYCGSKSCLLEIKGEDMKILSIFLLFVLIVACINLRCIRKAKIICELPHKAWLEMPSLYKGWLGAGLWNRVLTDKEIKWLSNK